VRYALAALLIVPLVAGCFGSDRGDDASPAVALAMSDIRVPDGASLEAIEGGFAALWSAQLPFSATVTVPEHATMIRLVADGGSVGGLSMVNAETGRRRCNNPTVDSFSEPFAAPKSCSSAAALDAPGAEWTVAAGGSGAAAVRVEFLDAPLDGLLGQIDLSRIDPPTQGVQDTEVHFVPSFDGTRLRVEVTLPDGPGPFPAVLQSDPYNDDGLRLEPASYAYVVEDWARRGYAMVIADVRGFGDSGGCVEVWGPNEQADQRFLVDWVAQQAWSDGNVGFYGQSYVGTTPVEAAVQAPAALKAIVTVAPVINAYEDWHFGGVPNGESRLSPVAYQVLTEGTANMALSGGPGSDPRFRTDPAILANNAVNGYCDPTLVARANDPRTTYTTAFGFYEERNFKLRAKDVTAAVLYTQGFEDANVKGAMIPGFFNELTSPKLGVFGHWLHQHPPRLDSEALMVGWFEEHLKGKDLGFSGLPAAVVQVDLDTERHATEWPPSSPLTTTLYPDLAGVTLGTEAADGAADVALDSTSVLGSLGVAASSFPTELTYRVTLDRDVSLAGTATLHVVGMLAGVSNAYLAADLYEGDSLLTWGQLNLAHNADHTEYTPVLNVETLERDLPFRPTERVLRAGTELTLVLRGAAVTEVTDPGGAAVVSFRFHGGADGTRLDLPGVPLGEYRPIALTARP
jgi:predicted acyl esterase